MYLACTNYLLHAFRGERESIEPAIPHLLAGTMPVRFLTPETRAVLAGLRTRGAQDQRSTVRLSDKAEIGRTLIYYLLTARFARKAKSKQATPVSAHPQWRQIPVHPGGIPPAKTGIPGRKSSRLEPVLRWVGSLECPKVSPPKKRDFSIFFSIFFSVFPPHFYTQKNRLFSRYLPIYIYIFNMWKGARNAGEFFFVAGTPNSRARQVGKVVPTIATDPRYFLMPRIEPGRQGKLVER
jgi:hypothetical protein